ncbi:MAG: PAS domain S-box protein [Thermomicrobiales bacterium]
MTLLEHPTNPSAPGEAALLQAALDALPAHVAILDAEGCIVAVNRAWRRFGAANDLELGDGGIGVNYLEACEGAVAAGDTDAASIVAGMRSVLGGVIETFSFDYPCHAPHERRWFAFRIAHMESAGDPRFLVSHENVTPQHLAEETALESEARYRAIFASVGDAILISDENGAFLDANPAAEALLGYRRDELLKLTSADLLTTELSWSADELSAFFETGSWRSELEMVRSDGQPIQVEAVATNAQAPGGPIFMAGVRDITRRRETERSLREEREALTIINQVGRLLSAELNLDALMQEVTDAATSLTGASVGAFFYNSLDERGESYTLLTLAGATAAGFEGIPLPRKMTLFGPTFDGDAPVRLADVRTDPRFGKNPPFHGLPIGHLPVVSYLALPVIGRHGDVLGGLFFGSPETGVFTERAERIATGLAAQAAIALENAKLFQQVQQELDARERAEAAKEQLVDAMAHDLGGPLTVIRGQAQLLRRRLLRGDMSPERLESALAAIDQAVERARLLISDLTDIARLEAERPLDLNRGEVDLMALAEAANASMEGTGNTADIRLEVTGERVVGWWDADRMTRVLDNLLANAIKYSPAGSVVTTRVAQAEIEGRAWATVAISDQGVGIPAEDLPHIFERFHRGGNVRGRIAGTGLGLWGSRRIVMQHGGEIGIVSEEGKGTTVTFRLPLTPESS